MKSKIVYLIISLLLATTVIIFVTVISNYFGKVATFEPVYIRISGVSQARIKDIKVVGYTPEGKESVFRFSDTLKSFHSYYGFLGSIALQIPINLRDSIDSVKITTGREKYLYSRADIDTTWNKITLAGGNVLELKPPATLKTKETKVRMFASTRYWQVTKVAIYILISLFIAILILRIIKSFIKR